MGRRHWFNDWARNTRDLRYLQRIYGPKTEAERQRRTRLIPKVIFTCGGIICLFIILLFILLIASDQKESSSKLEPIEITETVESVQNTRDAKAGQVIIKSTDVIISPTDTAAPLGSIPDAIPEPTIDPRLLFRYEEERIDEATGKTYTQCLIKGNINSKGSRIYHIPGSTSYDATKIDTSTGERWFCTEYDAIQAGWHAPGQ